MVTAGRKGRARVTKTAAILLIVGAAIALRGFVAYVFWPSWLSRSWVGSHPGQGIARWLLDTDLAP